MKKDIDLKKKLLICNSISIVDFLQSNGIRWKKHSPGGYRWEYACWWIGDEKHHLQVYNNPSGAKPWYWVNLKGGEKGDIVDLAKILYNTNSVTEAVDKLIEGVPTMPTVHEVVTGTTSGNKITLSSAKKTFRDANIRYAESRGISPSVTKAFMYDVFFRYSTCNKDTLAIGMKNDSGGYAVRTYTSKCVIGASDITTFRFSTSGKWVVFEGMFDFLAYWEHYKQHESELKQSNYIVLNSTSNIERAKKALVGALEVNTLLDNDEAGNKATEALKTAFGGIVKDRRYILGAHNDYNEYYISKTLHA